MSGIAFFAVFVLMFFLGIGDEPLCGRCNCKDDDRDPELEMERQLAKDSERARQKALLGPSIKKPAERWVTALTVAWLVAAFGLMSAIMPSRPMGSLEQWAYFGPT